MNSKKLNGNAKELSFREYYEVQPDVSPRVELRAKICESLGIPVPTFYDKLRNDRFNKLEKEAIASILGISIYILFPEEVPC